MSDDQVKCKLCTEYYKVSITYCIIFDLWPRPPYPTQKSVTMRVLYFQ